MISSLDKAKFKNNNQYTLLYCTEEERENDYVYDMLTKETFGGIFSLSHFQLFNKFKDRPISAINLLKQLRTLIDLDDMEGYYLDPASQLYTKDGETFYTLDDLDEDIIQYAKAFLNPMIIPYTSAVLFVTPDKSRSFIDTAYGLKELVNFTTVAEIAEIDEELTPEENDKATAFVNEVRR